MLVVDSSVALSWCFEDERTAATLAVLEGVVQHSAIAPALWALEIVNALHMAERRKRLTSLQRVHLCGFLHDLPIALDHDGAGQAWGASSRLADLYGLTLYDATNLELAQRRQLPLATLDRALRAAATSAGVALAGMESTA